MVNLNTIGQREPEIYGKENFQNLIRKLQETYPQAKITLQQSNSEGVIIDFLQTANQEVDAVVLNAGLIPILQSLFPMLCVL